MRVAVIDTGVDSNHPDLQGAIEKRTNVTSEDFSTSNGHGTGVAGVIAAQNNNAGVLGVAPDARVVAIKALNESGGGSLSHIVNAIDLAIRDKVDVINLSLGTTASSPLLESAINRAVDSGIYVVCAAGNSGGPDSVNYPAKYDVTYAVGAVNQNLEVSAFSSKGWEVDVAAPGERILTTWKNRSYARVSGTSFAAPYVSGVFLLLLQADRIISHELLSKTSIDIEEPGEDTKSGHGLINPYKIIKTTLPAPPEEPDSPPTDPGDSDDTDSPDKPHYDFEELLRIYNSFTQWLEKHKVISD